ncbi:MAG: Regulator of RpoS [Candidatus Scalindua arabica]|uniref:Regulator of RpoS n=1 Tax=Candidatus Scalindua arabica TaxID=1127984 RepID=A0A942A3X8_9BACT|nr:Regulator of RpoS [Candidatus Scalindua arabica]
MDKLGKILIADDEETFRISTADLLRKDGYECDCASDAIEAVEKLRESSYDLLIADIHMPGNPELELVREIPTVAEGMPVLLVTGYPSANSAIESIKLNVTAYLVKPVEFSELQEQVDKAIEHYRTYRAVNDTRKRLREWCNDLDNIKKSISQKSENSTSIAINTFFELTLRNVVDSLMDLKHMTDELSMQSDEQYVCNLLDCPSLTTLKGGLSETVDVLKKTKNSFKSKDLGELRKKLETIIGEEGK